MSGLRALLVLSLALTGVSATVAEEKKEEKPKVDHSWLAEWEYPGNKADWKSVDGKLFNMVLTTTDDVEKVFKHYQSKTCLIDREVKSPDGKSSSKMLLAAEITLPGGYAVLLASVDQEWAVKLGLKPDFARIFCGARDDSLLPTEKGEKPKERPVVVRVAFQDTEEFNVHVVVSRAKDEKHTHIIVTYLRK